MNSYQMYSPQGDLEKRLSRAESLHDEIQRLKRHGYTYNDYGDIIGISRAGLSRVVSGRTLPPAGKLQNMLDNLERFMAQENGEAD